jgi:hypothetical protein
MNLLSCIFLCFYDLRMVWIVNWVVQETKKHVSYFNHLNYPYLTSFKMYVMCCGGADHCTDEAGLHRTLRCSELSLNVAGLIPNEVIATFNFPNPSSRTMALGPNQYLTEMSTRNIPGRLKHCWQVRVTTSLPSVS